MDFVLELQKLLNIKASGNDIPEGPLSSEQRNNKEGYVVFGMSYVPGEGFPRPKLTLSPDQWMELGYPTSISLHCEAAETQEAVTA